jgi:hypothetical protein
MTPCRPHAEIMYEHSDQDRSSIGGWPRAAAAVSYTAAPAQAAFGQSRAVSAAGSCAELPASIAPEAEMQSKADIAPVDKALLPHDEIRSQLVASAADLLPLQSMPNEVVEAAALSPLPSMPCEEDTSHQAVQAKGSSGFGTSKPPIKCSPEHRPQKCHHIDAQDLLPSRQSSSSDMQRYHPGSQVNGHSSPTAQTSQSKAMDASDPSISQPDVPLLDSSTVAPVQLPYDTLRRAALERPEWLQSADLPVAPMPQSAVHTRFGQTVSDVESICTTDAAVVMPDACPGTSMSVTALHELRQSAEQMQHELLIGSSTGEPVPVASELNQAVTTTAVDSADVTPASQGGEVTIGQLAKWILIATQNDKQPLAARLDCDNELSSNQQARTRLHVPSCVQPAHCAC